MLRDDKRVDAICSERDGLRQELIELAKSMHKTLFIFLTVCMAFVAIFVDEKIITNAETRRFLLIGLTQTQFFCWLFLICLINSQNVHVGYIRALETQINKLNEGPISIWDSHVSKRFIASPRGMLFWSTTLLSIFSLGLFAYCATIIIRQTRGYWLSVVLIAEVVVTLGLFLASLLETSRVQKFSNLLFTKSFDEFEKANNSTDTDECKAR